MSNKTHYLYINFNDSSNIFSENTPWDFRIMLDNNLNLNGNWLCALLNISSDTKIREPLLFFCDFCENNIVCNKLLPVLRKTNIPESYTKLYNCFITRDQLKTFRIYIRTTDLKIPSYTCSKLHCTLRLTQY